MPKDPKVVLLFSPIASCASIDTRSVLQEFEETLEKIRKNAAGVKVFFWDAGLNDKDCLRLCEALEVAIQSNKQYRPFTCGFAFVVTMLVSAGFCCFQILINGHPQAATSTVTLDAF